MPTIAITGTSRIKDYIEAVRRAGGDPVVVEAGGRSAAEIVREFDGILLAGGGDILPSIYGEQEHPTFSAAEPGRDGFELELARQATAADRPVLAICRGVQVLNVSRGGTLVQDIETQLDTAGPHRITEPKTAIVHSIRVTANSLLHRLVGSEDEVNSRHHQALKDVGAGLVVSAVAPDGVVEAVEDPSQRFCLGVQWHPENFVASGRFKALFEAFVKSATPEN